MARCYNLNGRKVERSNCRVTSCPIMSKIWKIKVTNSMTRIIWHYSLYHCESKIERSRNWTAEQHVWPYRARGRILKYRTQNLVTGMDHSFSWILARNQPNRRYLYKSPCSHFFYVLQLFASSVVPSAHRNREWSVNFILRSGKPQRMAWRLSISAQRHVVLPRTSTGIHAKRITIRCN